jgi:hypothetical protein
MILLLLLLQAAAAAESAPPPPGDPIAALRGTVVEAIRECPRTKEGEIAVCSRDRGFAEGQRRLKKLVKPKPVDGGLPITIEVNVGEAPPQPRAM